MSRRPEVFQRAADRIHQRDPSGDGLRRAIRAGVAIPLVTTICFLTGANPQTQMFAMVGSIALMVAADFPGPTTTRAAAYLNLALTGTLLIVAATWAAPNPWVAVPLCFAVGALVSVAGLLSGVIAAGQRATLMAFLLAICAPDGPLDERLLGWLLALAICVPTALFLLPPRDTVGLRHLAAGVCTALADRIEGRGSAERLATAMDDLNTEFLSNAFRPVVLTAGSRALIRVVSNLQWLCNRVDAESGALLGPIEASAVALLRGSAEVLEGAHARADEADLLIAQILEHRRIALRQYADDIHELLADPDDISALERGRALLGRRAMSATIALTGRIIAASTVLDTRGAIDRLLGRGQPETGIADRVHGRRGAVAALADYLTSGSITVLNSIRTGLALALALGVTLMLPVQNGQWVALGALSVLRSSAAMTRTTVRRALAGTVIGFILGTAVVTAVGVHPAVLWVLLLLVSFGSAYVLVVGSFTASQAMFTMQVLIVFNMLRPTGWQIGLIRIEDVLLGALVGLSVSVLLWPGGAHAAVRRAIGDAVVACSWYLDAAVTRVTRGVSPEIDETVAELGAAALKAVRTHGDAVRCVLAETNGVIEPALLDAASRIPRLRIVADLMADIVPPPPGAYPKSRTVLEMHAAALCARIENVDGPAALPLVSDELIPALRAEAATTPEPELAALPLITAAANIGELELTYFEQTDPTDAI